MCRLRQRLQGRCHARSTRALLASTLARALLWREAARVPLRAAAARSLPCSLTRAVLASTLACALLWREAARVPPRAAAARSLPCSLDAGGAGFYAEAPYSGARRRVCRCWLRWLLRWRAHYSGAGRQECRLGQLLQGRCHARWSRAVLASRLARVFLWREAARVPPRPAAARSLQCSLDAGGAGFYAGAHLTIARGGACAA